MPVGEVEAMDSEMDPVDLELGELVEVALAAGVGRVKVAAR